MESKRGTAKVEKDLTWVFPHTHSKRVCGVWGVEMSVDWEELRQMFADRENNSLLCICS
jgi:hypothetical protein